MKTINSYLLFGLISILGLSCSGNVDPSQNDIIQDDSGAIQDSTINLNSGYLGRMIAMQFTSVGCIYCPFLASALNEVDADYPGTIIPVAFHLDYDQVADPMTLPINKKFYDKLATGNDSLPFFTLNFRKSSQLISNEYSKIVSEIELQKTQYPVLCGVAMETSYDADAKKVFVTAKFKSDVAGIYRCHIFLLEDQIEGQQFGVDEDTYIHNNVLRVVASDNIVGIKLNAGKILEPGVEYEISRSLSFSDEWNVDNMRVVVAMLDTNDDGVTFCCNNANMCRVGESIGYIYKNK